MNAPEAIALAVAVAAALWLAKRVGAWLLAAIAASASQGVEDVMKPHISALQQSIEDLRAANAHDHQEVTQRLGAVETELTAVETRLAAVEALVTPKES